MVSANKGDWKKLENRTKRLEWLKLIVSSVQTGWVDPYGNFPVLRELHLLFIVSVMGPLNSRSNVTQTHKNNLLVYFVRLTCKYLPKLRKFMLPYWEQSSEQSKSSNFTLPLPLGPNPRADEAHVRSDYNYLVVRRRLNYWRELWPFPSIIPKAAGERTHVNDKLAVNMTNKWTPQQLRLNFSDSFWLGTSGKEWWWVP